MTIDLKNNSIFVDKNLFTLIVGFLGLVASTCFCLIFYESYESCKDYLMKVMFGNAFIIPLFCIAITIDSVYNFNK